ncbi:MULTISPECIES: NAD-dependent epimerase/dehydratase family protein [unclassified Rhodococcus (in: high G+C Gram-positive bacteria)]|uniref:NAD-dependent epimerase/dehydratase family protein n=1 Tax=Rhodococcus sp. SJ-3 TaxID=3454628 RepID=UPI003F78C0EF
MAKPLNRIVVTGASGNVGTAVLRRFASRAVRPEIIAVARRIPPARDVYASARWHSLDLADPNCHAQLRSIVRDADAIVHLAWGFQPSHRRDYLRRTALGGTRAVFTAAAEAGVPHVVHMSSGAVYAAGANERFVDESWPVTGVSSCDYSADKVQAEKILDDLSADADAPALTRFRPGFIGQRAAGTALRRYVSPDFLPGVVLRHLPLLPIDRSLRIPAVHADDVAAAIVSALEQRVPGTFNLGSERAVLAADFVAPFECAALPVPWRALAAIADATWGLRIQPVQGGWIELAYATPMLDCSRAMSMLAWKPAYDGPQVWNETVSGMRSGAGTPSPVLRTRTVRETAATLVERGPIDRRIPP